MKWHERLEVRKGDVGEELIESYLRAKGYVVFRPGAEDGATTCDMVVQKDKGKLVAYEIKTKDKRKLYEDTGINKSAYLDYRRVAAQMGGDVFLVFVDANHGWVYGGPLFAVLDLPRIRKFNGREITYPWTQEDRYGCPIRYFPVDCMEMIVPLTGTQREQLVALSSGGNTQRTLFR